MIAVCVNWIPTCEDLPDEDITVMVAVSGAGVPQFAYLTDGEWMFENGRPIDGEVTYWADLPEVPE